MPFTAQEISDAGIAALNFHFRNKPVDQIQVERPWLKKLMASSKTFPGAKQYVTEQLRKSYDSNFQWYFGAQAVTYNKKQTLSQSQWTWHSAHDGFWLDEDTLFQNGITVNDEVKPGSNSGAEQMQLTDLLEEDTEALRLGWEEKFDQELHQDGTQDTEALAGLDYIIDLTPATGTVGGIDSAAQSWWRNNAETGISAANLYETMEKHWRNCIRNGGRPNFIMAGSDFIDAYRNQFKSGSTYDLQVSGHQRADAGFGKDADDALYFKGVPITWNPVFEDLDTLLSPATAWEKRAYFLNMQTLRLRPAAGHNMVTRRPPREYNRYVWYWAMTWKGSLTCKKRISNAVLAIA